MKSKFLFTSIIIFSILSCLSCELGELEIFDYERPEPILVNDCFQFKDIETNMPLEGVFVRIHYVPWYGGISSFKSFSDTNGMVCWEHELGEYIIRWYTFIEDYEGHLCYLSEFPSSQNIFLLKRASYYKFIIKNIEPQSVSDVIKIDYQGIECYGPAYNEIITLMGSEIDTIIIKQTSSGNNYVTWESTGANTNIESFEILTQSGDTASVEIRY